MNYHALVESIVALHRESSGRAALAVNRWLILRNWLIGAYLVEFEQDGEDRAKYGVGLLTQLAHDLKRRSVSLSSAEMLGRMRLFYRAFPQLRTQIPSSVMTESRALADPQAGPEISSSAMTSSIPGKPTPLHAEKILRLSWTHWIELLHLDDPWRRAFFENECLKGNWSVRQLQRQIGSMLYVRTGLSADKHAVIDAARIQSTEAPTVIADLIRDPYVLEFVGLAERLHYRESDLESALLDHLQSFLLELGAGFCFEARKKNASRSATSTTTSISSSITAVCAAIC
jgi:predicted nuclease of restriction endonuclease-like (RecB) superfamily